jgi:uroporphyrinogen decarboxylase
MNASSSFQRVHQVLSRALGAPVARGELVLDVQFAREFLAWKNDSPVPDKLGPTDLLLECCRSLKLDIICLPSDEAVGKQPEPFISIESIRSFRDAGLFVFWIVDGVFQSAVLRHGLMTVFKMIAKSPDVLAAEFKSTSDQVIAFMRQGVEAGAHGIILADDIAYNQGTYMSPDFIERYLQPVWKTQTERATELGVPVFFHSDGNLNKALPHITAAGFDGLQCIEPAAGMDVIEIAAQYGRSLCLMGGIDPALLVHDEHLYDMKTARKRLRRAITRLMESDPASGGFIVGSCSGLYAGMSPELVHCMYQKVSEFA